MTKKKNNPPYQNQSDLSSPTSVKNANFIPIFYVDRNTEKIGQLFQKAGYHPAYKLNKTPIPTYSSFKEKPDLTTQKGVYKITCTNKNPECNKQYIGFTNRDFKTRFKEHNTRHYQKPSSIVATHLKANKTHSIEFPQSLTILKKINNKNLAIAHESYEIFKHIDIYGPDSLINKKEDVKNSILFKFARHIEINSKLPDAKRTRPKILRKTYQHPHSSTAPVWMSPSRRPPVTCTTSPGESSRTMYRRRPPDTRTCKTVSRNECK